MIHLHLNKLRGIVAYVLGRTTVNDPGVADWEHSRSHYCEGVGSCGATAFDAVSKCRVDILSCSLKRHESRLLRVFCTSRMVILVISGVLSLGRLSAVGSRRPCPWLVSLFVFPSAL